MRPREPAVATPVQITVRGMGRSDALAARIRAGADELSAFYPHITNCHVLIERHDGGRSISVRMVLRVPGDEIVVAGDHEDAYAAVDETFATATRRLEDYARREGGRVKAHSLPARGKSEAVES